MSRRPTRRATLALAAVATLAGALATAVPAAAATTGSVTGVVRDGTTPVAGVVVTARTPADAVLATATTDATGTYRLTEVPTGPRVICFDGAAATASVPAGYLFGCSGGTRSAASARPVVVRPDRPATYDTTLDRATVVTGRATDTAGVGLAGVVVGFGDYGDPTVTTAGDGSYRYTFDARYESSVRPTFDGAAATGGLSTAGYRRTTWTVPGGGYQLETEPGQVYVVDQALPAAAAITGRVTDTAGRPLAGVLVIGQAPGDYDHRVTTGSNGRYRLDGLPSRAEVSISFHPDENTVGPSSLGYVGQCWKNVPIDYSCDWTDGAATVTTPVGGTRENVSARLQEAGGIAGQVTDAEGRPLQNVYLSIQGRSVAGGSQSVRTAADGSFRVVGLVPADYQVCYQDFSSSYIDPAWPDQEGYDTRCWRTGEYYGDVIPVASGALTPDIDLTLVGRGAITGRVVTTDGTPAAGVYVDFSSADGGYVPDLHTQDDGTFREGRLSPGTYTVCYGTEWYVDPTPGDLGFVRQCHDEVVTDNVTTAAAPVTVVGAGLITGRITDVYGFALNGVYVRVNGVSDTAQTGGDYVNDDQGTWSSGRLAPGRYTVCFDTSQAYRAVDNHRPRNGYASQCFTRKLVDGVPSTPVSVASGVVTGGIDVRIRLNRP